MKKIALAYHDVVADGRFDSSGFQGPDADIYKLDRAAFGKHLQAVAGNPARGSSKERAEVALTFDDGGISAVDVADMIEPWGFKGYFFITTDRIGTPGFLDEAQLRSLRGRGHAIGSHSRSHPTRMALCTPDELDREWRESVRALERILGEPVTTASVPGGYYSREVAASAARAGIRTLFTSEPVTSTSMVDGCLVVGRFFAGKDTSERWVASLAAGKLAPRLRSYLFWNGKKLLKAAGGKLWLRIRYRILARRAAR
jgi:peptidoglycan/xylan/chitin deacetylase (PgdA/CDA1 family)